MSVICIYVIKVSQFKVIEVFVRRLQMLVVVVERKRSRIVERETFMTCQASTPKVAETREARRSNPDSW